MTKTVDLSEVDSWTNPIYRKYYDDFRRVGVFKGGASAGKSYYVFGQNTPYNMIVNKGFNVMCLRKVGRDNHNSTFAEMRKGISNWGLDDLFDINHSKGAEEITCKINGNQAIFRGLDDVLKMKSVTFPTGNLVRILLEEATEATEEDFNQLELRLRGLSSIPKSIWLLLNPIDADHWINARFFVRKMDDEDGFICETTYKDNEFLDPADIKKLLSYKLIDNYYYMVYVLNKWGVRTTNRVLHNLIIEDFIVDENDMQNVRFGLDFGYNHANALEGIGFRDGELYIWKEAYAKHQLNSMFIESADDIPKDYTLIGDSAEPDKLAEWREAGFINTFGVEKSKGFLKRGVDYLKSLPAIHIHKTHCPNAAREFQNLRYREIKGMVLDEIVEVNDDTIAAVRHAVNDFIEESEHSHFFIKAAMN